MQHGAVTVDDHHRTEVAAFVEPGPDHPDQFNGGTARIRGHQSVVRSLEGTRRERRSLQGQIRPSSFRVARRSSGGRPAILARPLARATSAAWSLTWVT